MMCDVSIEFEGEKTPRMHKRRLQDFVFFDGLLKAKKPAEYSSLTEVNTYLGIY
jgi:hypothetical protein